MSAVTRPRGPLPPRVYWIRRALVLAFALLLVFTVGKVVGGGDDGSDKDARAAQVAAEPSPTTSAPRAAQTPKAQTPKARTPKAQTPTAKAPAAKAKPAPPPLAQPDGPCDPQDISVQPLIERAAAGGQIRIPFDLRGTEAACTWTVVPSSLVVKITSGKDSIWSSQQCRPTIATGTVVVRSAVPTRLVMVWNGRRSNEDCSRVAKWAVPGWYHVVAAALGGEPTDRQFVLTAPPRPVVTKTAKPKPKAG
jgi:hypothetical protein